MMLDADINSLETRQTELEIELNNLLRSDSKEEDKINELRSEILYLKKQIGKKLGSKEVKKQEEIRRKKLRVDERNIKNYNAFKSKYRKISKMEVATKNILKVIDSYLINSQNNNSDMVKVMSR